MSTAWKAHAVRRSYLQLRIPTAQRRQPASFLERLLPSSLKPAPSTNEPRLNVSQEYSQEGTKPADALSTPVPKPRATNGNPYPRHSSQSTFLPKLRSEPSLRFLEHGLEFAAAPGRRPKRVLDYTYLRDSCSCPKCIDPSTTQKSFQTSDIPLNIVARLSFKNRTEIRLLWSNDVPGYDETHESSYEIEPLMQDMRMSPIYFENPTPDLWDANRLKSSANLWHSFHDIDKPGHLYEILESLASVGIAFLKDVPQDPATVGHIADKIGGVRKTFYGDIWDVKSVPKAANVAYTSQFLGFHMDLLYLHEPPGLQLLHCLTNTCKGGESMFSDALKAAYRFRNERPDDFYTLSNFPVPFKYKNGAHHYWKTRTTIETQAPTKKSGAIRLVNWSPPFQGPLCHIDSNIHHHSPNLAHDGTDAWLRRFISASHAFSKELESEENVFELKLEPGQCVIFNNRRVVHARRSFDEASGERWLQGTYVDSQDFWSTHQTLKGHRPDEPRKRREESTITYVTDESARAAGDVPITKILGSFPLVKPPSYWKRVSLHRKASSVDDQNRDLKKEQASRMSMLVPKEERVGKSSPSSGAQTTVESKPLTTQPSPGLSNSTPSSWSKGALVARNKRSISKRESELPTSMPSAWPAPSFSFDSNENRNNKGTPSEENKLDAKAITLITPSASPSLTDPSNSPPTREINLTPSTPSTAPRVAAASSANPGTTETPERKRYRTQTVVEEKEEVVHDDVGLRDFERKMFEKLKIKGVVDQ
jgi:gamma-butyrobetaine dioxygenase